MRERHVYVYIFDGLFRPAICRSSIYIMSNINDFFTFFICSPYNVTDMECSEDSTQFYNTVVPDEIRARTLKVEGWKYRKYVAWTIEQNWISGENSTLFDNSKEYPKKLKVRVFWRKHRRWILKGHASDGIIGTGRLYCNRIPHQ